MTDRVISLIENLQACYPNMSLSSAKLNAYAGHLADLNVDTLEIVTTQLARTSKFMPSVAEIREAYAAHQLAAPSTAEAWEQARATDGDIHPIAHRARNIVGDSWHWRTADATRLHRQFSETYEQLIAAELERRQAA